MRLIALLLAVAGCAALVVIGGLIFWAKQTEVGSWLEEDPTSDLEQFWERWDHSRAP